MKKTFLTLCFLAASFSSASAALLTVSNYEAGLTLADGTTALASGRVRFGTFVVSNLDITNNMNNLAYLDANFRAVVDYSGPINALSTPGFIDNALLGGTATYAGGATAYGGTTYDLSGSGSTANVANDIAGSNIFMWVLDNTNLLSATQQGIFASTFTWTDTDLIPDNGSAYSTAIANNTALVGVLGTGDDIGAGANSHRLGTIAAVPEPSRAMLVFLGIGGFFLRRRRA
ncbi:MAG: PEP-CTERM sorting domain-containing protein [Prosthecobacter sp.]